ncbi:MAG: hypothetical protein ACKVS9_13035 [Phycisphaerae bacterium]
MDRSATSEPSPRQWSPRAFWIVATVAIGAVIAWTTTPMFRLLQLEPDDYRYLHLVQRLDRDFVANVRAATIVENRWDHLWWMRTPERVAFFRPTVIASYWLDAKLWGDAVLLGLHVSNLAIYFTLCLLATAVLVGWFGHTWPALLASVMFTAHPSHSELIWYIAGRTDSIAGVLFLAALALHQRAALRPTARVLCPILYAMALLTKEWAACLPIVCFLHDWVLAPPRGSIVATLRRNATLYGGYVLSGALVFGLRLMVMRGQEAALVYPYFVSPLRPDFFEHLLLQLRSYGPNLLIGSISPTLVPRDFIRQSISQSGLAISAVAAVACALVAMRDRRAIVLLAIAIGAWLPASVVYLSERYLLLPSLAMAGVCVSLVSLIPFRSARAIAGLLIVLWTGWFGQALYQRHELVSRPRPVHMMTQRLLDVRERLRDVDAIFVANLPGMWLDAQFAADQVRWLLADPSLRVCVLNVVSPLTARSLQPDVALGTGGEIVLRSNIGVIRRARLTDDPFNAFERAPFQPGDVVAVPTVGIEVRIDGIEDGEVVMATVLDKTGARSPIVLDVSRPDPIIKPK